MTAATRNQAIFVRFSGLAAFCALILLNGLPLMTAPSLMQCREALAAEPAKTEKPDDGLDPVRILIKDGKFDEALAKAKAVCVQKSADLDVSLRALCLMSQCYEKQGALEKELLCCEQIGASDWAYRLTKKERDRMFDRLDSITTVLEKNLDGLPAASLVRLSTMALGLRKPLKLDEYLGGKADVLTLRLSAVRARAYDGLENRENADVDRYTVLTLPVADRLQARFEAAVAVLGGGDAQRDKLLALLLDTPDDATAFICQAALTQHAVASKEWPAAMAQLKRLYYLCSPTPEDVGLLYPRVSALAKNIPKDAMAEADAKILEQQFSVDASQYGPAKRWTVNEVAFALSVLKATLPEHESEFLKKRLGSTAAKPTLPQRRLRVRWLLLSDQADAALREAYEGYRISPRGLNIQIEFVHEFVKVAKARKGTFVGPVPFLEYAAFGPEGRDGKAGTADDLKDPFDDLLKSNGGAKK